MCEMSSAEAYLSSLPSGPQLLESLATHVQQPAARDQLVRIAADVAQEAALQGELGRRSAASFWRNEEQFELLTLWLARG
jgi:hypothetical protein